MPKVHTTTQCGWSLYSDQTLVTLAPAKARKKNTVKMSSSVCLSGWLAGSAKQRSVAWGTEGALRVSADSSLLACRVLSLYAVRAVRGWCEQTRPATRPSNLTQKVECKVERTFDTIAYIHTHPVKLVSTSTKQTASTQGGQGDGHRIGLAPLHRPSALHRRGIDDRSSFARHGTIGPMR